MMEPRLYSHWKLVPADTWPCRFFTPEEIACKGSEAILVHPWGLRMLDALRGVLGVPVHLTSAYRTPQHNAAVGGGKLSMHLQGLAFDVALTREVTRTNLTLCAERMGFGGIGQYHSFVHVDLRRGAVRWDER